jgi:hypothetical protein
MLIRLCNTTHAQRQTDAQRRNHFRQVYIPDQSTQLPLKFLNSHKTSQVIQ